MRKFVGVDIVNSTKGLGTREKVDWTGHYIYKIIVFKTKEFILEAKGALYYEKITG